MRYNSSQDGKLRTSVRVVVRLDPVDVAWIKERLRKTGEPYNDESVRNYVRSHTEFLPPPDAEDDLA